MKISGVTGTNENVQAQGVGRNGGEDAFSKNIQQQLANLNQQLQQLSSNKNMTPEEKMKKRQQIQQEIANLNQQLRQHQMEQKKQQAVEKEALAGDSRKVDAAREDGGRLCLSQAGMEAMISADSSMKQAKVQTSVATRLEGRARVMESEIKQDAGRGGNVAKKEAELSDLLQRAQNASMAQGSMLADASRTMAQAPETEMDARERVQENQDEEGKDRVQGDGEHVQEGKEDVAKDTMPTNYKSVNVLL